MQGIISRFSDELIQIAKRRMPISTPIWYYLRQRRKSSHFGNRIPVTAEAPYIPSQERSQSFQDKQDFLIALGISKGGGSGVTKFVTKIQCYLAVQLTLSLPIVCKHYP